MGNIINQHTIRLDPGARFRLQAGPYDLDTGRPHYAVKVNAPDDQTRHRVEDNSHIMGSPGQHFYVWDIKNASTFPVFLTLTVDGGQIL
ncbi:hypothetical protein N5E96_20455 [Pseudomonas mosselii]|uniref:hypothetical protein n=1 Tax=Pseudomonas mosselii TaxID=78327 RepID=UPI00244C80CE|nr:hypothetical protein [Pseudomonas mosselii]MDH1657061.1 hypothetical protein [Pseudomonas mosselii]MDH1718547.1 hypothetical protein [Pseudomonas mosselii]MDH1723664.1 hypothetical protein [Pseudomonas mosselii]